MSYLLKSPKKVLLSVSCEDYHCGQNQSLLMIWALTSRIFQVSNSFKLVLCFPPEMPSVILYYIKEWLKYN